MSDIPEKVDQSGSLPPRILKKINELDWFVKAVVLVMLFMLAGLIINVVSGYKASSQNLINQINEQSGEIDNLSDKVDLMFRTFIENERQKNQQKVVPNTP